MSDWDETCGNARGPAVLAGSVADLRRVGVASANDAPPPPATVLPCAKVEARERHDKRHGRTTSERVIDYIRRTCECAPCVGWRRARR